MKKRLLIAVLAVVSAMSSFAYTTNDYAYTPTQRVKILGDNIVTNGDFATTEGYTNAMGEGINTEVWSLEDGVEYGLDAGKVLKSTSSSTDDAALCAVWPIVSPGTYVVMYDIKGDATTPTGLVSGVTNCIDFFLTAGDNLTKGEDDVDVSTVDGFKEEWKTNSYVFTAEAGHKLVMHIEKLAVNAMISNIQIYPVQIVYDDRILKAKLDYVDRLIATEKFVLDTENGFVENIVEAMRSFSQDPELMDDISTVESIVASYEDELLEWLNLNGADILKEEKRWSAYGDTRKMNGIGGNWQGTGGRWFHKNNGGSNEITDDGDEIGHRFQGGMAAGAASQYYTITPTIAGTYMFSLDVVGHYMAGTSGNSRNFLPGTTDNYVTDWNRDFKGVTVYVGKDIMGSDAAANETLNVEQEGQKVGCGLINNPNAKANPQKFVVFYEVSQEMIDAKTPLTFGMTYVPDPDQTAKLGSNVNIANPQIRLIGTSQEIIDFNNEVEKIIVQQGPLKERLDWAREDNAKTAADGRPWGHTALGEAIEKYQPVYEFSLTIVDAEGNVLNADFIRQMMAEKANGIGILYSDSLLNTVKAVNSARSAFSNINKPIDNFKQKVKDAEAIRDDAMNSLGNKEPLQTAINDANAKLAEVLATTTDETREADEITLSEQLDILALAVDAFKESAKLEPFIDIDFSNNFEEIKDGEGTGTGAYMIKGAKGQMEFSAGSVNIEDNTGAPNEKGVGTMDFAKGFGEELLDVLRIGRGTATVNVPEGVTFSDNNIVRFDFNLWFVQLSGGTITIELQNAENQRLAAFAYCAYGNIPADLNVNTLNNEANEGLDLAGYATSNRSGDVASCVDGNKNSFSMLIDYKAQGVQGILVTSKGTCTGKVLPLNTVIDEETTITDTKVAKFVLTSNYGSNGGGNYVGRRCWFDDLKAYQYPSQAEGPLSVTTLSVPSIKDNAVYTLSGVKVNKQNLHKGLYIVNGKKVVVK